MVVCVSFIKSQLNYFCAYLQTKLFHCVVAWKLCGAYLSLKCISACCSKEFLLMMFLRLRQIVFLDSGERDPSRKVPVPLFHVYFPSVAGVMIVVATCMK